MVNRKEFVSNVTKALRENNIRKAISIPKNVFHISDLDGNGHDFEVKQLDKNVIYTKTDVNAVIDACIAVVKDALKRGEEISFHGFGVLGVHYRKSRRARYVGTNEWGEIEARFVPKFSAGKELYMAAKLFEMSSEADEKQKELLALPEPDEDGDE